MKTITVTPEQAAALGLSVKAGDSIMVLDKRDETPRDSGLLSWGYCRVSTAQQKLSPDAQAHRIREYIAYKDLPPLGDQPFSDEDVSGGIPFFSRPGGQAVYHSMRRGDHLIIPFLDRGFRSIRDAHNTVHVLKQAGINIHILDISMDPASPMGEVAFSIMVTIAQWERRRISQRMLEAYGEKRRRGLLNRIPRPGFMFHFDKKGRRTEVPDPEQRAVLDQLLELRRQGMSFDKLYWHVQREGIMIPSWKHTKGNNVTRSWLPNNWELLRVAVRTHEKTLAEETKK